MKFLGDEDPELPAIFSLKRKSPKVLTQSPSGWEIAMRWNDMGYPLEIPKNIYMVNGRVSEQPV